MWVWDTFFFSLEYAYKLTERLHFLGTSGIGMKIKSVPKYF